MLEIGLGFVEGGDSKLLRRCTPTKTGDLRKDKPDPVTSFCSGSEFSEDCVVGGCLGGEEALEVVKVIHGVWPLRQPSD